MLTEILTGYLLLRQLPLLRLVVTLCTASFGNEQDRLYWTVHHCDN